MYSREICVSNRKRHHLRNQNLCFVLSAWYAGSEDLMKLLIDGLVWQSRASWWKSLGTRLRRRGMICGSSNTPVPVTPCSWTTERVKAAMTRPRRCCLIARGSRLVFTHSCSMRLWNFSSCCSVPWLAACVWIQLVTVIVHNYILSRLSTLIAKHVHRNLKKISLVYARHDRSIRVDTNSLEFWLHIKTVFWFL